jgi:hypothetical protein
MFSAYNTISIACNSIGIAGIQVERVAIKGNIASEYSRFAQIYLDLLDGNDEAIQNLEDDL